MTRHRIRLITAATLLTLAGCGSSGHHAASSSSSPSSDAAVRAAMRTWFAATTPAQACAAMTTAFRRFVGNGDPAKCAADYLKTRVPLPNAGGRHFHPTITTITYTRGLADLRASFAGDSNNYYFAKDNGAWKLNSIGIVPTTGPVGPSPSGMPPASATP